MVGNAPAVAGPAVDRSAPASFVGALAGYLDQSKTFSFDSMKLGVVFGSVLASFCVEDFGVKALTYLDQEDLDSRYDEFVIISQF